MASVNKCIFVGNVTRDVECRYMPNGDAVSNLSIACNESWKDKQGAKHEKVEYINLVAYRKLAEIFKEYVKKGSSIYVEGRMQTRKWEAKDGSDRYTTEIIVDSMQMLGRKPEGQSSTHQSNEPAYDKEAYKPENNKSSNFDDFEDDIPFN